MSKCTSTRRPTRKVIRRINADCRFFVVHKGQTVFQSAELIACLRRSRDLPGSMVTGRMSGETESRRKKPSEMTREEALAELKENRRRRALECNPLAEILNGEAYCLFSWFEEALKDRDPSILAEDIGSDGRTYPDGASEPIRATNEECASFNANVTLTATFDHRKNLVEQLGNWLRKQAKVLEEAAAEFLEIEDYRHFPMIERLINEQGLADHMNMNELCVSPNGRDIVTHEEYMRQSDEGEI